MRSLNRLSLAATLLLLGGLPALAQGTAPTAIPAAPQRPAVATPANPGGSVTAAPAVRPATPGTVQGQAAPATRPASPAAPVTPAPRMTN
jgi:hypothetical protein